MHRLTHTDTHADTHLSAGNLRIFFPLWGLAALPLGDWGLKDLTNGLYIPKCIAGV